MEIVLLLPVAPHLALVAAGALDRLHTPRLVMCYN